MYDQFNSENNDFNRMQQKIKDTIDSMISDNHIYNPPFTSSEDNMNSNDENSSIC